MKTFKLKPVERLIFTSPQGQARVVGCTNKVTKGRCPRCNRAYVWPKGKLRLYGATCPICGGALRTTVWYLKSVPWYRCEVEEVK
jgi:hypothetical protein